MRGLDSLSPFERRVPTLNDCNTLAAHLARTLGPGQNLGLSGTLGAGKTTFVQFLLRQLGVEGPITSPTFSLINEYSFSRKDREERAHHLDLYRLNSEDEVFDLGVEELLEGPDLVLVEWAEKFPGILGNLPMLSIEMGNPRIFRLTLP